ncbi:MAG: hypothetical protein RJB66_1162 [Pseudomonadota bacterium]|jgi:cytochrome b
MKLLIWDLPIRLFHWLLAGSVVLAFGIAQFIEKETPLFYMHVVFGVLAGLLIVWRIIWGLIGSKHARWSELFFSPTSIAKYFTEVFKGRGAYYAGHNPGGSIVVLLILAGVALSVISGILNAQSELFEEIHESLPILVMGLVVVHVTGVILAMKMHNENYVLSMITGYKKAKTTEAISTSSPFSALVMLVLVLGPWIYFIAGFNRESALFTAPGTQWSFQIGEAEAEEGEEQGETPSEKEVEHEDQDEGPNEDKD